MNLGIAVLFQMLFLFTPVAKEVPATIYECKSAALNGGADIDLSAYKGKKILIVNVPSQLMSDPQYADLDALAKKYAGKLVVIGYLSDDFAIPPGEKQAHADIRKDYNVSFPITGKTKVRGPEMEPAFKWLTMKKYNNLKDSEVKWNFQKYLVNERGELVAVFDPKIRTTNPGLIAEIEK